MDLPDLPLFEDDRDSPGVVTPGRVVPRGVDMPETTVLSWFHDVVASLPEQRDARRVVDLRSENGRSTVWEIEHRGERVAVVNPGVGAPIAAIVLEEVVALGARRVVACGGAGALLPGLVLGHAIVVESAVRDEGTSFQYAPPGRIVEADPDVAATIVAALDRAGVPHVVGRAWTTDALYRETRDRTARRIAEGCVAVEMEASALIAVARHLGVAYGHLLMAGDSLAGDDWQHREWTTASDARTALFDLALDAAVALPVDPTPLPGSTADAALTFCQTAPVFGMLRPCRHRLPGDLADAWTAHLCGLCLTLRDRHGHAARLVTNTDAVAISVLVEAQTGVGAGRRRDVGPCALRGMRRASVAQGEAATLAATVSLTLAAAKLEDHVADGDTSHRLLAAGARVVAGRAARAAGDDGAAVGFAAGDVLELVRGQAGLERGATAATPLLHLTAPTESATATAFAHTATIAGQPANAVPLAEVGRLFGRLAHLLDAVEDLAADRAAGRFNPVDVTGTPLADVRALCNDALLGIRSALLDATFSDRRLVHRLLVHETEHAVDRAFGTHGHAPPPGPGEPAVPLAPDSPDDPDGGPPQPPYPPAGPFPPSHPVRNGLLAGCFAAIGLCCSGQMCCSSEYQGPFSGQPREGFCHKCDCSDCCDCDCCGDGCCCDGCDCDCC